MTNISTREAERLATPEQPAVSRWNTWRLNGRVGLFAFVTALLVFLVAVEVLYPLIRVVLQAFGVNSSDKTSIATVYTDGTIWPLLGRTILMVVASGLLALVVGSMLAWLNERTDARMGALTDNLPMVPFFLPPIAGAIGWVFLLSPTGGIGDAAIRSVLGHLGVKMFRGPLNIFSWYGLVFVLAIYLVPYVYMMVSAGLRNLDPRLEEQARVSGSKLLRTIARITLPAIRPSLGGAALLIVWVGMSDFSIPAIIGTGANIDVISVRIATLLTFSYPPKFGAAFGLCLTIVVISGGVWLLQRRALRQLRFSTLEGKGHGPAVLPLGRWKWVARLVMALYLIVAALLPLLALVLVALNEFWSPDINWGSLNLSTFHQVLFTDQRTRDALFNSLRLAVIGASIGVALAAVFAVRTRRSKRRLFVFADGIVKFPAAVPSMVLAVGILLAFGGHPFYWAGTVTILLFAYIVVGLPEATVAADAAAAQVGNELAESSTISGAQQERTFFRVFLPLMIPGLIIGWAFLFVRIMGDINASVILAGNNNQVVGFYIYQVYSSGNYAELAALASILCGISLVVAAGVAFLGRYVGVGKLRRAARVRSRPRSVVVPRRFRVESATVGAKSTANRSDEPIP